MAVSHFTVSADCEPFQRAISIVLKRLWEIEYADAYNRATCRVVTAL